MITYLHLENFVKHTDKEFVFNKGLTAICGRNGGGKSLIQEAIRFALFGTPALRGKLENYDKKLKVTARFVIGGKPYEIVRSLKDCKFGDIVGTTACNKAIEDTLSFGMNVFDMGCCAKQFEITRLGDMKPTERKQAVDKLIGLDTLELLRKDVKQTISELKGRKEGMEKYLTKPVEPNKPENYQPSEEVRIQLEKGRSLNKRLGENVAIWSTLPQKEPVKPQEPNLEPLNGSYEKAQRKKWLEESLKSCTIREEPIDVRDGYTEELNRLLAWENFKDLKEPVFTQEKCEALKKEWQDYENWISSKKITCPECGKTFSLSGVKEVKRPDTPKQFLLEQMDLCFKWSHRPAVPQPTTGKTKEELRRAISECEHAISKYNQYLEIKTELDMFGPCSTLEEWIDFRTKSEKYNLEKANYDSELKRYKEGIALLSEITDLTKESSKYDLKKLEELERIGTEYETEYRIYKAQLERYEEVCAELEEIDKELVAYQKADEGLVSLKSKIKLYVIPSLQKVATNLVSEMTDGELNSVTINEEFEICVNGKELNLLSGSEKAVANLAIRLGLGCVLTHKVFNVFMGDEIDESMSEERAGMVADSLHKLLNQIDQIILISHKNIPADNYIQIGC